MDESPFDRDYHGQTAIDRRIAALATRQSGVISRAQLRRLRLSLDQIDRRVTARRLIPLYRGVYAVGHGVVGTRGRRTAAALACGKSAHISHRAAGHEWSLVDSASDLIDVTLNRRRKPQLEGIRPHLCALPEDEVGHMGCLPITNLARTVIDLASTSLSNFGLRVVLAKAERQKLDWRDLEALVARYPRRHGVPRLRRVIAAEQLVGLPNGPLEMRLAEWLVARDLPLPEFNQWVHVHGIWVRPDAMWRRQQVLAEVQSRQHHDGWLGRVDAAERLTALTAAGWKAVEITARALAEGTRLERDLRALLF